MPSLKRPIGASGAALAMALVAAACGSGGADTTVGAGAESSSAESTAAPSSTGSTEATQAAPAETEGPTPVVEHSFPSLDTVSIADGSTVNLAEELAGGSTPVLLWFWAPH